LTTVVISQPLLLPWPGFFELLARADVSVHLDDVQLASRGFITRIQVKQSAGSKWMTISVQNRSSCPAIGEIHATASPKRRQRRECVRHALSKAPHLKDAPILMDRAYSKSKVVDFLIDSIEGPAGHPYTFTLVRLRLRFR
jgi:WbqC-like protein